MQINLAEISDKNPLKDPELYRRIAQKSIEFCGLSKSLPQVPSCLNLIVCDDEQITKTNWDYLRHEGPTDVISFDYIEDYDADEEYDDDEPFAIGELFISTETAMRQAREYNEEFNSEFVLYLVHGILHLAGLDDHCDEDIKAMRAAEAELMQKLREFFPSIEVI